MPMRIWLKRAALVGAGAVLGAATVGGAGGAGETPRAPTTAVEEVRAAEVPAPCLEALDLADRGFRHAGTIMGLFGRAVEAIGRLELDRAAALSERARREAERMGELAPSYNEAKAACRAQAS